MFNSGSRKLNLYVLMALMAVFRLESMFRSSMGPRSSSADFEQCHDCYDFPTTSAEPADQFSALAHALNLGTRQEIDRAVLAISCHGRGAVLPLCFKWRHHEP